MRDADKLVAEPLDLNLGLAPAHADRLDRQQLSLARRLNDIRGCGQLVTVKLVDDCAAGRNQLGIGHENSLVDNRAPGALLFVNGLDGPQSIVGLLLETTADCLELQLPAHA